MPAIRSTLLAFCVCALAMTPGFAAEDADHDHDHDHEHEHEEARGLDAHVHGHGVFNIAVEDGELHMELEAPGADIVGFEHAPESEEDKAAVAAAMAKLNDPLSLFIPSAAAGCALEEADVELHVEEETGHSEFHAVYHIDCADLAAVEAMAFPYFTEFPGAEELDVTVVSDKGQKAYEVERDAPDLDLGGAI